MKNCKINFPAVVSFFKIFALSGLGCFLFNLSLPWVTVFDDRFPHLISAFVVVCLFAALYYTVDNPLFNAIGYSIFIGSTVAFLVLTQSLLFLYCKFLKIDETEMLQVKYSVGAISGLIILFRLYMCIIHRILVKYPGLLRKSKPGKTLGGSIV